MLHDLAVAALVFFGVFCALTAVAPAHVPTQEGSDLRLGAAVIAAACLAGLAGWLA